MNPKHPKTSIWIRLIAAETCLAFFAGTSAKFDQRHVRQSSFFFAVAAFLFAAVRMLMLPVA